MRRMIFYFASADFFLRSISSIESGRSTPIIPITIAIIPVELNAKFAPSVTVFSIPSTISVETVSLGQIA